MLRLMDQLSLLGIEPPVWSVGELNRRVRQLLESDYRLQDLWVSGDVSNLSRPSSGHLYFSLVDAQASVRCVMWRSQVASLARFPRDGEAVEVHGHVSVYEAGGQYQLYADAIRPAGEGALFKAFLELRDRLEAEGLFGPARKRPLPPWPKRIGVVTSPTAAALRDVINVLRRRFPLVTLILAPTPVQGEEAPPGIVASLQALNRHARPDLILVVRGGGSMEDLWAFNDENVVRAVAASEAPVVTGIGHETDVILADFAADRRAPTPSAAAELATPDRVDLIQGLGEARLALARAFETHLGSRRRRLEAHQTTLRFVSPLARIVSSRQRVDEQLARAWRVLRHDIALRGAAVTGLIQTLHAVSPGLVLARGYSVVTRQDDGSVVRSVTQVASGDPLRVRVHDGEFGAEVSTPKPS